MAEQEALEAQREQMLEALVVQWAAREALNSALETKVVVATPMVLMVELTQLNVVDTKVEGVVQLANQQEGLVLQDCNCSIQQS